MSKPASGKYIIYNRVLNAAGEKLALNFNGEGQPVTVKPLDKSKLQIWNIVDFDAKTQSISPESAGHLQAAWGKNVVTVLPAQSYVWTIRSTDSGYTIQDGGVTAFWGVTAAESGADASILKDQATNTQRWIFEKA